MLASCSCSDRTLEILTILITCTYVGIAWYSEEGTILVIITCTYMERKTWRGRCPLTSSTRRSLLTSDAWCVRFRRCHSTARPGRPAEASLAADFSGLSWNRRSLLPVTRKRAFILRPLHTDRQSVLPLDHPCTSPHSCRSWNTGMLGSLALRT